MKPHRAAHFHVVEGENPHRHHHQPRHQRPPYQRGEHGIPPKFAQADVLHQRQTPDESAHQRDQLHHANHAKIHPAQRPIRCIPQEGDVVVNQKKLYCRHDGEQAR